MAVVNENMNRRTFSSTLLALSVTVLASCASTPRTAEEDLGYKRIGVLSILDEKAPVVRIGLTVFNNDSTTVDLAGRANATAEATVEQHLKTRRSDATILTLDADRGQLLQKLKASWGGNRFEAIAPEIGERARETDLDAIFVVAPWVTERSPVSGVGISMRTLSLSTVQSATAHAEVVVYLVNREGHVVTNRGGGNNRAVAGAAAELGLKYDLSSVATPAVQEACAKILLQQLASTLDTAMRYFGY